MQAEQILSQTQLNKYNFTLILYFLDIYAHTANITKAKRKK